MGKGICFAGNILVDETYPVDGYPRESELAHILGNTSKSLGGLAANCSFVAAALDPDFHVSVSACIGDDELGKYVRERFAEHPNINTAMLVSSATVGTGYTLVISNMKSKARTFFTYTGANRLYGEKSVDWDNLSADIIHAGYIFLLEGMDELDAVYGTKMAAFLHAAQKHGFKTSVDVVSQVGADFPKYVPPALKYTDYCIINELEAQQTAGILLRDDDGTLHRENFKPALEKLKSFGVGLWAIIHCPELSCGIDENGEYHEVESLKLPDGYIKGTVGAGDAFCAGVLYAADNGRNMPEAMLIGNCTAAASLSEPGAIEGIRSLSEVMQLAEKYGR